jgi:hypothetical protein
MFVLIEMEDIELKSVRLFQIGFDAFDAFEALAKAGQLQAFSEEDLAMEAEGTLMAAGDDAYSVALIEQKVQ